jgi:hypothetical protein
MRGTDRRGWAVTAYPLASTDLVCQAWIAGIPGFTASGVGAQLPAAEAEWAAGGYVVVPFTVGGTPMDTAPVQRPVVQVECWATVPNSDKLPWRKAQNLADQIRMASYDRGYASPRPLQLPAPYPVAWVRSVKVLTHPKRIWSDAGDYAGVVFDLWLMWIAEGENIP